jgi:hypothetical protein
MKKIKNYKPYLLFFFISLVFTLTFLISPIYANETINITEFPDLVGDAFTVSSDVAGLILSGAVMLSVGLALAYLKAKGLILIAVEFIAMSGCIMLGWLPYFVMLVVVLIIALFYASRVRRSL